VKAIPDGHFKEELVAPCGANCNVCAAYRAKLFDVKAKGVKIMYCPGCRPRDKQCSFLKKRCGKMPDKAGHYCFECAGFPCDSLKKLDERYRTNFRMSMVGNLEFIKQNGIGEFLRKEKERWPCLKCEGAISCHNGLCFECDIEKLRKKKQKYRWT
jgi:hypothetical protein